MISRDGSWLFLIPCFLFLSCSGNGGSAFVEDKNSDQELLFSKRDALTLVVNPGTAYSREYLEEKLGRGLKYSVSFAAGLGDTILLQISLIDQHCHAPHTPVQIQQQFQSRAHGDSLWIEYRYERPTGLIGLFTRRKTDNCPMGENLIIDSVAVQVDTDKALQVVCPWSVGGNSHVSIPQSQL
ncbi:MAG TPA: hypothetical protein VLM37_06070 [Fibrobacteraceae bacterium]|nr:hypothetical protein [Fibrobacteraceae bacterium]